MLAEWLLLGIAPLLAIIISTDALVCWSKRVSELLGIRNLKELPLLAIMLGALAMIVFLSSGAPQVNFALVQYVHVENGHIIPFDEETINYIANLNHPSPATRVIWMIAASFSILAPLCSMPIAIAVAKRQERPLLLWALLGALGNVGAVFWLLRMRRGKVCHRNISGTRCNAPYQ